MIILIKTGRFFSPVVVTEMREIIYLLLRSRACLSAITVWIAAPVEVARTRFPSHNGNKYQSGRRESLTKSRNKVGETTRDRSRWRKSLRWSSWGEDLSEETDAGAPYLIKPPWKQQKDKM